MYDVEWLKRALVFVMIEKPDFAIGALAMIMAFTEPVPGPFTGIEY